MNTKTNTATSKVAINLGKFDHTVLVLQGGGALGAYQAGVYAGLAEAAGGNTTKMLDPIRKPLDPLGVRDKRRLSRRRVIRFKGGGTTAPFFSHAPCG
jgi:hypothetical protein